MDLDSSVPMQIPMGYVYLAVPIAGFFIALYSLEFLIEKVLQLRALGKDATTADAGAVK